MPLSVIRALLVVCSCVALNACTARYAIVGSFNNSDEVYVGTVNRDGVSGTSLIDMENRDSGSRCTGTSKVTHVAADHYLAGVALAPSCGGEQGQALLTCNGGRTINAKWAATSCGAGAGKGTDQDGMPFSFAFGSDGAQAALHVLAKKKDLRNVEADKDGREHGFNTGSGFFISGDGYFVTNYHVIDGSENVVAVVNGKELPATLVRSDRSRDIVVLKVDARTPWLPIEQTRQVSRGEDVFTLGYPFIAVQGQHQKASFGRVNALSGIKDNERYMQIDVPIQPGNSGGPLINERGNVIGVITSTLDSMATLRRMGAIPQNVNYALKADYLMPLIEEIPRPARNAHDARSVKDLVSASESAVVLVIAR
jgi:S1-C subfamily serine protease